jgi:phosphoenolpyruvate carboxylase
MTELKHVAVEREFQKVSVDLALLTGVFRDMLLELGLPLQAAAVPWQTHAHSRATLGGTTEADGRAPLRLAQVCAIAFQLLNLVEDNVAAQSRRTREAELGTGAEEGLWGEQLGRLTAAIPDPAAIAQAVGSIRVEPVLTAHPTEAKRAAVLEQHREIYRQLSALENPTRTPAERRAILDELRLALERVWRSGEILLTRPTVADERRNVVYYLREVFPTAIAQVDLRLRQAWAEAGHPPELFEEVHRLPRLRFGTWVGGDRDGHPLVTAEVTRESLCDLRRAAIAVMDGELARLSMRLSLTRHVQPPDPVMDQELAQWLTVSRARADAFTHASDDEPWRQYADLLRARLPGEPPRPLAREPGFSFTRPEELAAGLARLAESLRQIGAGRIAAAEVGRVQRMLTVFGFHLAGLDIRQNSTAHELALAQLVAFAGLGDDYTTWDESRRVDFLMKELQSPRPFLPPGRSAGPDADRVLDCYRVLREHLDAHGRAGLGSLIVSMTRSLSDLLTVYVLAREVGLANFDADGLICRMPVVPLFETLDDLNDGPQILADFLDHPATRRSVATRAAEHRETPTQQVMIGYSDSNKDGGILASQWALHQAQLRMSAIGREHGVRIRFFHGRGGTISRGAGPTHRFLDALPHGTLDGDFRLTEQGETVGNKYATVVSATYHLELLMAGVAGTTLRHRGPAGDRASSSYEPILRAMADHSRLAYQSLVSSEGFFAFYRQATPIDVLERSGIGSRPPRRTGMATLADLRAIPWVFSWSQARFLLPGWFGVGTALERLANDSREVFDTLRQRAGTWPFVHYVLTNVEAMLASTDIEIMSMYAGLVENEVQRSRLMGVILAERERSVRMVEQLFGEPVSVRRPRLMHSLALRQGPLRQLHDQQVEQLRRWRSATRRGDSAQADLLLPDLLLSINAIASGLRATG